MTNMDVWNKVCKTDPKYTKPVTFGRSFTAIDPMYQVRKATEQFGMVGKGWGFEVVDKLFLPTDYVTLTVRVWAESRENYIEHIGMCGLYSDNKKTKPDSDCIKKAMTDGVTKGLSYFGFSADVFLGMFDDSRYVDAMRKEIAARDAANDIITLCEKATTGRDILNIKTDKADLIKRLEAYPDIYSDVKKALNKEFNDVENYNPIACQDVV